jgi:GGDEF-like domain/PucR C-terminal helix-turn-helix domain
VTGAPQGTEVESKFRDLVDLIEREVDGIVEELLALSAREDSQWSAAARPELLEPQRRLARDSIQAEIRALREGRLPSELAAADAELAQAAARIGAPLSTLGWGFRASHQRQWQRWFELVESREQDPGRRRQMLERGSAFFFAYADRMLQMVTAEYTRERERLLRSTEQRRFHLVRELLDGTPVDSASLGYDLGPWHVGLVVWGPAAGEAVHALAGALGRRLLLVGVVEDTYWAWISFRDAPGRADVDRAARLIPEAEARLAVGGAHRGPQGFRRTHREARDAHRVALSRDGEVTRYEEVALVVLAARDEDGARAFLASELRGLEGSDVRTRRLRQTLATYLACGLNAAATAHRLSVHEQTVTNRLRAIEERTGRAVLDRHAELATALGLRALLRVSDGT